MGQLSGGQFSSGEIILGGDFPWGNNPGDNLPGGIGKGAIIGGRVIFLGCNCPDTYFKIYFDPAQNMRSSFVGCHYTTASLPTKGKKKSLLFHCFVSLKRL